LFRHLSENHPQVGEISIGYDGAGDEGYVNVITYFAKDGEEVELTDAKLEAIIDDLFCAATPLGFETNEGGEGKIHVEVASKRVEIHHSQRVLEEGTYEV
jgi:hypothetical protein